MNNLANLLTITPDAINHGIINDCVCSDAVTQLTRMPMPGTNLPFAVYQSILEPWTRLAMKSPDVINLRMVAMPWLMLTDPVQAAREIEQMLTEKHEALTETLFAISQTPMQLWFDMVNACWSTNPHLAFNAAVINSSQRVAHPSNKRVKANRKRLGNLH